MEIPLLTTSSGDVERKLSLHHPSHVSLQVLLGIMALLLSWDHVFFQFQASGGKNGQYRSEMWEGPYSDYNGEMGAFLTRSLSHLCAPSFFFTMGTVMMMFTRSRRELLKWTWMHVFCHHILRGCIFIALDFVFDWPTVLPKLVDIMNGREFQDMNGEYYGSGDAGRLLRHSLNTQFNLLTSLGLGMILSTFALPLFLSFESKVGSRKRLRLMLGVCFLSISLAISTTAIIIAQEDVEDLNKPPAVFPHLYFQAASPWDVLQRFMLYPGTVFKPYQYTLYPVFPWVGVTFLGMSCAVVFKSDTGASSQDLREVAIICCLTFFLVRRFGGVLNFRGIGRDENNLKLATAMEFFIQTKYPPDLAFISITLAVLLFLSSLVNSQSALLLEDAFEGGDGLDDSAVAREEERRDFKYLLCSVKKFKGLLLGPLIAFGRSPFFFYVVHRWVIKLIAAVLRLPSREIEELSVGIVIIGWMLMLMFMYNIVSKFHRFVETRPSQSLWRLL